jgi:molybdate transport system substrate-binding protein
MKPRSLLMIGATGILVCVGAGSGADAADLKFMCPVAMRAVMPEVTAQFERASGHKLTVEFATAGAIVGRLAKDEAADVAVTATAQLDDLIARGKITTGTRAQIAKVGVGVFVRAGAPKPDIASIEGLKRTLQAASAIGYGDPARGGVSGVHMAALVDRFGLSGAITPKTKLFADSQAVLTAVASKEVEVGIGLTSDAVLAAGVDLVGGLPDEVQSFTLYAAGVVANSKDAAASSAFVKFLSTPAAQLIFKAKGFQPL